MKVFIGDSAIDVSYPYNHSSENSPNSMSKENLGPPTSRNAVTFTNVNPHKSRTDMYRSNGLDNVPRKNIYEFNPRKDITRRNSYGGILMTPPKAPETKNVQMYSCPSDAELSHLYRSKSLSFINEPDIEVGSGGRPMHQEGRLEVNKKNRNHEDECEEIASNIIAELMKNGGLKHTLIKQIMETGYEHSPETRKKHPKDKSGTHPKKLSIHLGKPVKSKKPVPHRRNAVDNTIVMDEIRSKLEHITEEPEASDSDNGKNELKEKLRGTVRWIGVSGHEHDDPYVGSPDPNSSSHYHFVGSPTTPHIIVSTDCNEGGVSYSPDDEGKVSFPHDDEGNEKKGNEDKDTDKASPLQPDHSNSDAIDESRVSERDHEIIDMLPNPSTDGYLVDIQREDQSRGEVQSMKNSLRSHDFRNSSVDISSVEYSPVDEKPLPFFPSHDGPIEDPGQPEYHHRNLMNPPKSENNHFRSTSMASLEPIDPYARKTRRNSMIGMMRRVSSQSNVGPTHGFSSHMDRSTSRMSLLVPTDWKVEMNESLIMCVSALYGKLLVVMGMAFPIAEVISEDVPDISYNSFYLYLYFGSILFLIYTYLFLLRANTFASDMLRSKVHAIKKRMSTINLENMPMPERVRQILPQKKDREERNEKEERISVSTSTYKPPKYTITESSNHGSMYLKMGAVIFGIGSMIYSGLEFGQYFELRSDPLCANLLMAITPVSRMIFTFLQMYFIFLNSRVAISKHTIIARFGLMHMIGTNLCIWLNVLVQETKHEIEHLAHSSDVIGDGHGHGSLNDSHGEESFDAVLSDGHPVSQYHGTNQNNIEKLYNLTDANHNIVRRSTAAEEDALMGCRRINLMGHVVSSASPFLFPCTIEYSLLCAGVLYVMWKNININKSEKAVADGDSDISTFIARKVRHHYSVDCARASRGLFMGIFVLVLTIISLILFYVLISNEQFKHIAILEANIIEVSIYSVAIISVIVGMKQMRELEFIQEGDIELDNILLIIAQVGVCIYTCFTIIGGYFSIHAHEINLLPLVTAVLTLIQTTIQTLFILDGSRRCCYTADQLDRKPGREMITFLLVCNLAMWAISTFETSRADVHPTQLYFYGIWAWTIISHVSMPLAIFYRFHVTVCLGEIWKRSYKMKNEFIGF